ncbi:DgyrCDS1375 [Dimorphilus gyrociliatus]|uniref:DgyrCDS1375 n=1 Tax=Dimorphilus gyrociliatus TaxID=2664684 RepID=A0A7I8V730_9ANNE|nr:DgyrCDS1375 [Dimorphilus gyrociliatus]
MDSRVDDLQTEVHRLIAENQRLHRELRESMQNQLDIHPVHEKDTLSEDQILLNLQTQLQLLQKEKESAIEMWQLEKLEVDRLEVKLKAHQYHPKIRALDQQARQLKDQYTETVAELHAEINRLQIELEKSKSENHFFRSSGFENRCHSVQKFSMPHNTEPSDSISHELKKQISALEESLQKSLEANEQLRSEKGFLEDRILRFEKLSSERLNKDLETSTHMKEGVSLVENAILERDQSLMREKQLLEEIERLKYAFDKLVDEAGARTVKEVDLIKNEYIQKLNRMNEDLKALEIENAEKTAQLERSIREKRAVEAELDKLYQEGRIQGSKDTGALQELNRRACEAERLRDEATIKAESFKNQLKRNEVQFKQEKEQVQRELEQLNGHFNKLKIDFDLVNDDRVKLLEQVDDLKRRCSSLSSERDSACRKLQKELTCAEKDLKLKIEEFEIRIHTSEDEHRNAMKDLRNMLTAQQKMSARWKEECETISRKYELKVKDLREDMSREKIRNEELKRLLKDSKDKAMETESLISEYSRNIKNMEDRVREAENRAKRTSMQIANHLTRERKRQFDKSVKK